MWGNRGNRGNRTSAGKTGCFGKKIFFPHEAAKWGLTGYPGYRGYLPCVCVGTEVPGRSIG